MESLKKFGAVLEPDRPWEKHCAVSYGAVMEEDGLFRMWYETFDCRGGPGRTLHCHAESTDGVRWDKPSLGVVEWNGSKGNNIVMAEPWMSSFTVIRDPDDEPGRRYKMLYRGVKEPWGASLFAAFSRDGISWNLHHPPVIPGAGDRTTLLFDRKLPRPYVAFTRMPGMLDTFRGRIIYRADSDDFIHWSTPEPMLVPDLDDPWGPSVLRNAGLHIPRLLSGGDTAALVKS